MIGQSGTVSSWIIFITLFSLAGVRVLLCRHLPVSANYAKMLGQNRHLRVLANYAKMLGQNQLAEPKPASFDFSSSNFILHPILM
jgi:hypothetical protein